MKNASFIKILLKRDIKKLKTIPRPIKTFSVTYYQTLKEVC